MEKKEQMYEGKAKKVFATDNPDLVVVDYKDDATAFNGLKKGTIAGKGVINNKMSNMMFRLMEKKGIPKMCIRDRYHIRCFNLCRDRVCPLERKKRGICRHSHGDFCRKPGILSLKG